MINSAGSGENVKLLRENEVQFATLQELYGYYAWSGKGPVEKDGPQIKMRSVSMLWQNVEQFTVLSEYAKTGTVSDLADMKSQSIVLGKKNSGSLGSNTVLLKNLGIRSAATAFFLGIMSQETDPCDEPRAYSIRCSIEG